MVTNLGMRTGYSAHANVKECFEEKRNKTAKDKEYIGIKKQLFNNNAFKNEQILTLHDQVEGLYVSPQKGLKQLVTDHLRITALQHTFWLQYRQ